MIITVPRSEFAMMLDSANRAKEDYPHKQSATYLATMLFNLEICAAMAKKHNPSRVESIVRSAAIYQSKHHPDAGIRAVAKKISGQLLPTAQIQKYREHMKTARLSMMGRKEWETEGYPTTIEIEVPDEK